MRYVHGNLHWNGVECSRAYEVHGPILTRYNELGGPQSYGYPETDVTSTQSSTFGSGLSSRFEDGRALYWSPSTGAHAVYGLILSKYRSLGAAAGFLAHGRNPSVFDGDGLVDTPPDPGVEELSCASTETVTLSGVTFTLPRTNVMSSF